MPVTFVTYLSVSSSHVSTGCLVILKMEFTDEELARAIAKILNEEEELHEKVYTTSPS